MPPPELFAEFTAATNAATEQGTFAADAAPADTNTNSDAAATTPAIEAAREKMRLLTTVSPSQIVDTPCRTGC